MPEFDDGLPANLCQDNGEIFFRGADKARFDRVFQAVVHDAQHLLMTSQYDGVIDHYGKMMLNRLKMRSGMAVETYMPASTEALVSRFNELVNSMSVEQARGEQPSDTPGRIIIVNDPKAVDSDSWALLSRMITDFPGLNMRLVFLLDRIPAAVEKALDRFGSRLLSWEIEPPSATEQLALRKEGMQAGLEFQVERVLSRINQTVSRQLEPELDGEQHAGLQIDVSDALGEASEAGEREAEDMRALFEEETAPKKKGGMLFLVLGTLVLVALATLIAGFVSPDVGRQLDRALVMAGVEQNLFSRDGAGQSIVDAAYDQNQSNASESNAGVLPLPDLAPLPEGESEAPQMPETPRTELTEAIADASPAVEVQSDLAEADGQSTAPTEQMSEPSPDDQTASLTEPEAVERDTTASTSTDNTEPSVAPVTAETPVDPSPVSESVVDQVQSAPANAQFVQHIVLLSEARAAAWRATQANLQDALVVPIRVNRSTQFAVVSGPFIDPVTTRQFVQGLGEDADYWVRTAGSLQGILQTEE